MEAAIAAANDAIARTFECVNGGLCEQAIRAAQDAADLAGAVSTECLSPSGLCQAAIAIALAAADTAVRLGLGCANGENGLCNSAFATAGQAAQTALGLADSCLNDSGGACQNAIRSAQAAAVAAEDMASELVRYCALDPNSVCNSTLRTASDSANAGVQTAVALIGWCLNEYSSLCNSAARTAYDTADGVATTATGLALTCVNDSYSLCQSLIRTGLQLASEQAATVTAAANSCLNDNDGLCQTTARTALSGVQSCAASLASGNRTGLSACETAAAAIRLVVTIADQCLDGMAVDNGTACAAARQISEDLLDAATACVNQTNPVCAQAVATVQGAVTGAQACAAALASGTRVVSPCEIVAGAIVVARAVAVACVEGVAADNGTACAAARQIAQDLRDTADDCVNQTNATCAQAVSIVQGAVAGAQACAAALASGTRVVSPCEIVAGAIALAKATAIACVNQTDAICRQAVADAQALLAAAQKAANDCASETDPSCALVLQAVRSAAAEAGACAAALVDDQISTTGFIGPMAMADPSALCVTAKAIALTVTRLAVETALGCVNLTDAICRQAVADAQALLAAVQKAANDCASETDPSCAVVLQAVRAAAAEAGACAAALVDDQTTTAGFIGPQAMADPSAACVTAKAIALAVARLVVDTAIGCVNQTDATCREAVADAQALLAAVQKAANDCASETDPSCALVLQAVRAAAAEAGACAAARVDDQTTTAGFVDPQAMADPSALCVAAKAIVLACKANPTSCVPAGPPVGPPAPTASPNSPPRYAQLLGASEIVNLHWALPQPSALRLTGFGVDFISPTGQVLDHYEVCAACTVAVYSVPNGQTVRAQVTAHYDGGADAAVTTGPATAEDPPSEDSPVAQALQRVSMLLTTAPEASQGFAGSYVDYQAGSVVVLVKDSPGALASPDLSGLSASDQSLIRVQAVRYSGEELEALQDRAEANAATIRGLGLPVTGFAVNEIRNRVTIFTETGEQSGLSALTAMLGVPGDMLEISSLLMRPEEQGGDGAPQSRHRDSPPYYAGSRVWLPYPDASEGRPCTVGFHVRMQNSFAVLTAGHCSPGIGRFAYSSTGNADPAQRIGLVTENAYDNNTVADALLIPVEDGFASSLALSGEGPELRPVQAYQKVRVGDSVCKDGRTTNYTCGLVANKSATIDVAGEPVKKQQVMVCSKTRHGPVMAKGGDSGGPASTRVTSDPGKGNIIARGLVSVGFGCDYDRNKPGKPKPTLRNPDGYTGFSYSTIPNILSKFSRGAFYEYKLYTVDGPTGEQILAPLAGL